MNWKNVFKMDKEGEDRGGGSGEQKDEQKSEQKSGGSITLTKEQYDDIMSRLPPKPDKDPSDLRAKAKNELDGKEKEALDAKKLEAALKFKLDSKDWIKKHENFLPKTMSGIFEQAEKQTYDSPIEKDSVLKMNIVDEFFSLKANVEFLTQSQKARLDEFLKLTNTKKQERAQAIYEEIFEPTLEMMKQVEKAKQLNSGNKFETDLEKALTEKMMKRSKAHYLGDKENA